MVVTDAARVVVRNGEVEYRCPHDAGCNKRWLMSALADTLPERPVVLRTMCPKCRRSVTLRMSRPAQLASTQPVTHNR